MTAGDLATFIVELKKDYQDKFNVGRIPYEILPLDCPFTEINEHLPKLNEFAVKNPIFYGDKEANILGSQCKILSCELTEYWIHSKKYDACYQPFYPTWLFSALVFCLAAKSIGFLEIVDIGSGDARVPYCGAVLGLRTISVELDSDLTALQRQMIGSTGVEFEIINDDACTTNFRASSLSRPIFLLSGLPEHGDFLAENVISNLGLLEARSIGFALMGSHSMKKYTKDSTVYGWGQFIEQHNMRVLDCLTLPTMWTNELQVDTPFIFSLLAQES